MYSSTLFLTSALEWGEGSASRLGRTLLPVPIVQEVGWASGPVWTGAENLDPTGIRSPDRPVRRQSLYRLRYPELPSTVSTLYRCVAVPCISNFVISHVSLSSICTSCSKATGLVA
jgi:hypothetical protein